MNVIMNKIYKKNNIAFLTPYSLFFIPFISYASAFGGDLKTFVDSYVLVTFKILVPILTGIAFLLFFWGVAKFILSAGEANELEKGRQMMIWGVLAIFVLVSFWGIIRFLSAQFDFTATTWQFLP